MADSQLWIQETIEIRARQLQGDVGQADASPLFKPTARLIADEVVGSLREHGELIREQDISAGPVAVVTVAKVYYLAIQVNNPCTLTFNQSGAHTITIGPGITVLNFTHTSYVIDTLTVQATVDGTQIRLYWAGRTT